MNIDLFNKYINLIRVDSKNKILYGNSDELTREQFEAISDMWSNDAELDRIEFPFEYKGKLIDRDENGWGILLEKWEVSSEWKYLKFK